MTTRDTARRRGNAFERKVRDYLRTFGWNAQLCDLVGKNDIGDITGMPGHVVQCKATTRLDLGAAMTAAEKQRKRADQPYALVVEWRRNHGVEGAYAIVPLAQYCRLVAEEGWEWTGARGAEG